MCLHDLWKWVSVFLHEQQISEPFFKLLDISLQSPTMTTLFYKQYRFTSAVHELDLKTVLPFSHRILGNKNKSMLRGKNLPLTVCPQLHAGP